MLARGEDGWMSCGPAKSQALVFGMGNASGLVHEARVDPGIVWECAFTSWVWVAGVLLGCCYADTTGLS